MATKRRIRAKVEIDGETFEVDGESEGDETAIDSFVRILRAKYEPAIHILRHGLPLCRFTERVPKDWPEGHTWVDETQVETATCAPCIRTLMPPECSLPRP